MATPQPYDPTQSYQPTQLPDPVKPAVESPFQGQPGINMTDMGRVTHGGAIAGIFDNVLRGAVNGYAQGQQHKVLLLKKKSDDLNASYNADAQRAYQYAQSQIAANGKLDPNDETYKQLKSAVDGSWGALNDFRAGLLEQQGGGKKKGKKKDDQQDPLMAAIDPKADPMQRAAAIHALSQKVGPPVFGQIQSLVARANSDIGKAQFAAETTAAQTGVEHQKTLLTHEQAQQTYDKFAGKPEESMSEDERTQFANAQAVLRGVQTKGTTKLYASPDGKQKEWYIPGNEPDGWNASATTGATKLYVSPDGKKKEWYAPGTEPTGWNATSATSTPKLGTLGAAMAAYATENGIDPNKMSQADQDYVRQKWAWDGRGDSSSTATTYKQNAENQWVPVTETNQKARGPEPKPPAHRKPANFAEPPVEDAEGTPAAAAAPPVASATPPTAAAAAPPPAFTPTRRTKPGKAESAGATVGGGNVHVGQPLFGAPSTDLTQLREDANSKAQQYKFAVKALFTPNNPAAANDILMAYTRSQVKGAGRMNDIEIKRNLAAGTFGQRLNSNYQRIVNGTIDQGMLRNMVHEMEISNKAAQDQLREAEAKREEGTVVGNRKATSNDFLPKAQQTANPHGHKVGDIVEYNGQKVKITAIDEKTGKATGEPVP